jgi:peptide/nickel transport system substrate-binding protein
MREATSRRAFLRGSLAALATPAIARAAAASTLRFIPQIDLTFLDPHFTTATITRNHACLVFDTLYGMNGAFRPTPQMLEGHLIEADGKLWTLRLRDNLFWHDGTKVLARDCTASIRRWARRDPLGDALLAATDELAAPDDRTIRFRLKKPFPLLPEALGKSGGPICAMMPERLAATDAFTQITDIVGSGPFRFVPDERVQGDRVLYARFDRYVPRPDGTPEWTAGPKIAHFERIEWHTITDPATAAAALQNREQDWLERPTIDVVPLLRRHPGLTVEVRDPTGTMELLRPNHLQPPFNNPAIRRALLWGISQNDFMQAIVGDNVPYDADVGIFCPHTPMASDAGLEPLRGKRDPAHVKDLLHQAGYGGERTVLLVPTDYAALKTIGDVAADMLKQCGMNVDYVATDWGTMLQRRAKKGPVEDGGWSVVVTGTGGADLLNPALSVAGRCNGNSPASWPGWCVSPKLEALRDAWIDAPDLSTQQQIAQQIQIQSMQDVPFYPLGQFQQPTAYSSDLTGMVDGFAVFWNIRRS